MNRLVRPVIGRAGKAQGLSSFPIHAQAVPGVPTSGMALRIRSSDVLTKSFSIFSRKKTKKKTLEEMESYDIDRLEQVVPISVALSDLIVKHSHPLHELATTIKDSLTSCDSDSVSESPMKTRYLHALGKSVAAELAGFDDYHIYRENCIRDNLVASTTGGESESDGEVSVEVMPLPDSEFYVENKENFETMIRLRLLRNYLLRIQRAVQEEEVQLSALDTYTKCCSLVDAFLRGTPAERMAEHMELYGPTLTPWMTQNCFYAFCEPEIDTISSYWLNEMQRAGELPTMKRRFLPFLSTNVKPQVKPSEIQLENMRLCKDHKAKLVSFSKSYLLDTLELNVKARCCFAWTGE